MLHDGFFGDIVSGITQYQVAKAQRPNSPWIPDLLEYGMAGPTQVGVAVTPTQTLVDECGKELTCVKAHCYPKRRHRRKRLATASDLKDLAALKAILGGGKSLDTWLATRGRR